MDDILRMAREADPGFEGGEESDGTMTDSIVGIDQVLKFAGLVAAAEREACARHFYPEMHRIRVNYEHAVKILTSIHALLYPPVVTDANGQTWKFKSPIFEEQMQELSDRIRAIPDELAALDAATIRSRGNQ